MKYPGYVTGYDKERKRGQNEHTWQNIQAAIRQRVGAGPCVEMLGAFVGYLVLDAWIANTDRHHQNWALLQTQGSRAVSYRMCPSFDHASSLGRELRDERRREWMTGGIDRYRHHKQARGAIYWESTDQRPLHQLELVRRIARESPTLVHPWLRRLRDIPVDAAAEVIQPVPETWMSPMAKEFALCLVNANRNELLICLTA